MNSKSKEAVNIVVDTSLDLDSINHPTIKQLYKLGGRIEFSLDGVSIVFNEKDQWMTLFERSWSGGWKPDSAFPYSEENLQAVLNEAHFLARLAASVRKKPQ